MRAPPPLCCIPLVRTSVSSNENRNQFMHLLEECFIQGSFIKATLSKPLPGYRWRRAVVSAFVNSRGLPEVSFEYSDGRQVERKNAPLAEAFQVLLPLVTDSFRSVYVKTSHEEVLFDQTDRGSFRLKRKRGAVSAPSPLPQHNRQKHYLVPSDSPFLVELGITSKSGSVKHDRYDKFRQIQKFIEIISSIIPAEVISSDKGIRVVDFGSGKHYLTFALHHFLTRHSCKASVLGVEHREELVVAGKNVANQLGLTNLDFMSATIDAATVGDVDLVVALHACDTATDDALFRAISSEARYICVAPCCHKYVRHRFSPSQDLEVILRHGILSERFAESLTDSLRVLVLESFGYQTKLFEFISSDHTAKNTMITAVKKGPQRPEATHRIRELCHKFQLKDFYLDLKLQAFLQSR
jgi:hypothetical protein